MFKPLHELQLLSRVVLCLAYCTSISTEELACTGAMCAQLWVETFGPKLKPCKARDPSTPKAGSRARIHPICGWN